MGSPSVGRPAPRRLAPRPDFQAMPHRMSKIHCYDLDIEWDKFGVTRPWVATRRAESTSSAREGREVPIASATPGHLQG
jgi:hypothetical protein